MLRESVLRNSLMILIKPFADYLFRTKTNFTSWRLFTCYKMLLQLYLPTLIMSLLVVLSKAEVRPGSSHPWCRRYSTPSRPCRVLSPPARSWRRRRWRRSGRRPPPHFCRRRRRRSRPWRCSRHSALPRRRRPGWRRLGWVTKRQSGQQNQVDQTNRSCVDNQFNFFNSKDRYFTKYIDT